MKKVSKIWIAVGVIVLIAIAVWIIPGGNKSEKISFSTAKVSLATIQNSITATGTVDPESVTVGTQVSGIIS